MNLVFGAEGLSVGEGAFLMACANHTDDRGYVIAHMQQLADEAHMSLRSAQDNKARLLKRNLVKASPRFSPKNGAQIANLFRINLAQLGRMQRKRTDYGPTLIEELTFDAPEQKPSSDPHADLAPPPAKFAPPHADLAPPPAKSAGGGGARSAPLLLPSSSPSSLSPAAADAVASAGSSPDGGEREEAAPGNAAVVPVQRLGDVEADEVLAAYTEALRRPMTGPAQQALRSGAVELLAQGFPVWWLCDRAKEMATRGWTDLVKHAERSTVPADRPAKVIEWCGACEKHTRKRFDQSFEYVDCPDCSPLAVAGAR